MNDKLFCTSCGNRVGEGVVFCTRCGQKVEGNPGLGAGVAESPKTSAVPVAPAPYFEPITPKPPKAPRAKLSKKSKLVIFGSIGLVATIFVSIVTYLGIDYGNHIHLTDSQDYALSDYVDMTSLDDVLSANCTSIKSGYATKKENSLLEKRLSTVDALSYGDARKSKSRIAANSWINTWTPVSYYSNGLYSLPLAVESQLEEVISQQDKIYTSDVSDFYGYWIDAVEREALDVCKIKSINAAYSESEGRWSSTVQAANDFADTAPWYPEGYNEWTDDPNVAWHWVKGGYCDSGDSCWQVRVITNTGCTDGVYVELNVKDSYGTVIDYSNDTLSYLGAGESAQLELPTWNSSADTGQVTKISCHNF